MVRSASLRVAELAGLGLHHHRRHVVADHVVQLAGHAGPLLQPGRLAAQLARPPPRAARCASASAAAVPSQPADAGRQERRDACRRRRQRSESERPGQTAGPAEPGHVPGSSATETKTRTPSAGQQRRQPPASRPRRSRRRPPPSLAARRGRSQTSRPASTSAATRNRLTVAPGRGRERGSDREHAQQASAATYARSEPLLPPARHAPSLGDRAPRCRPSRRPRSVPGYRSVRHPGPIRAGARPGDRRAMTTLAAAPAHRRPAPTTARLASAPCRTSSRSSAPSPPSRSAWSRVAASATSRCSVLAYAVYWVGDILDGWSARRLDQETRLGAVLDIVSDRACTSVLCVGLVAHLPGRAAPGGGVPAVVHGARHDALAVVPLLAARQPQRLPPGRPPGLAAQLVAGGQGRQHRRRRRGHRRSAPTRSAWLSPSPSSASRCGPPPASCAWSRSRDDELAHRDPARRRHRHRRRRCCRSSTPRCTPSSRPAARHPGLAVALVVCLAAGPDRSASCCSSRPPAAVAAGSGAGWRAERPGAASGARAAGPSGSRRRSRSRRTGDPLVLLSAEPRPAAPGGGQPRRRRVRPASLGVRRRSACSAAPRGSPRSPCPPRSCCGQWEKARREDGPSHVREGGFEPPRPFGHWDLNPARLPFRHSRVKPGKVSPAAGPAPNDARSPGLAVRRVAAYRAAACRPIRSGVPRTGAVLSPAHRDGPRHERRRRGRPATIRAAAGELISGAFARAFRSPPCSPSRSPRAPARVRQQRADPQRERRLVPNDFHVELSDATSTASSPYDTALAHELVDQLQDHADAQGYVFPGPISIEFEPRRRPDHRPVPDPQPGPGQRHRATPAHTQARRAHATSRSTAPGTRCSPPGLVVGRGTEADLRINDPGVSRRHIEFEVDGSGDRPRRGPGPRLDQRHPRRRHEGAPRPPARRLDVKIGNTEMTVRIDGDATTAGGSMSELTLFLIRIAYLAILWIFVLSGDLGDPLRHVRRPGARGGARPPNARAPQAARPRPRKPRRGSPTHVLVVEGSNPGARAELADAPDPDRPRQRRRDQARRRLRLHPPRPDRGERRPVVRRGPRLHQRHLRRDRPHHPAHHHHASAPRSASARRSWSCGSDVRSTTPRSPTSAGYARTTRTPATPVRGC